jgi:catechol 2,3-dioxygenase-like lactoylglutathione lyase family enzyme
MARVTGIGGIFIKARDPQALREWYRRHLQIDVQPWGGTVFRGREDPASADAVTVWTVFGADTDYFEPSPAPFMVNFRVGDLRATIASLRSEGCEVLDPEGNKIELWEPPPGRFPG